MLPPKGAVGSIRHSGTSVFVRERGPRRHPGVALLGAAAMREQQGVAMRRSNARRKARRSSAQRKATAYHEASHAVIGRVLTCVCGGATIKPRKGRRAMPMPASAITNGKRRGKMRGTMAVYHAQIMVKMAGAEDPW